MSVSAGPVRGRRVFAALGLPAFLVLLIPAAIAWFFLSYVPRERAAAIDFWYRDVGLRADNRGHVLQRYLTDCWEDAATFADYPVTLRVVSAWTVGAASQSAPGEVLLGRLEQLLDSYARIHRVLGVVLWDAAARPVAKSGDLVLGDACAGPAREVLASGRPAAGFHLDAGLGPVLTFAAPVRSPDGVTRGVAVITIDPRPWVYPTLGRPVAGTSSGEAVLVARDGEDALFLSPLRFRPDAPLAFRLPLNTRDFAARAALEGNVAAGSYVDYRGVRVVGAGRLLEPTPWAIVVKVDEVEAFAAFRKDLFQKGITWGALLVALSVAALGLWRLLAVSNEVKVVRAETRAKALIQDVFDHSLALLYILDMEGRFLLGNRKLESLLGSPSGKLVGQRREAFMPEPVAAQHRKNDLEVIDRRQGITFEETNEEPDGQHVYSTVKFPLFDLEGKVYAVAGISTDVTERKRAEDRIRQLNRLLKTIGEINQIIVHIDDRKTLLEKACHVLVEHGGFRLAWIGFVDPGSSRVVPAAQAGDGLSCLDGIEIRADDLLEGRGPTGTAIRKGRHVVIQDLAMGASAAPWRERMLAHGFHSMGSFPIRRRDEVVGTLVIQQGGPIRLGDEEIALLDELAGDIGYALTAIEDRVERKQAEEALRGSETRYRQLFENIKSGVAVYDVVGDGQDFIFRDLNRAGEEIDNDQRERLIGKSIFQVRPGVERFGLIEVFRRVWETGVAEHHPMTRYEDEHRSALYENYVYKLPSGEIVAVFEDVTESHRKQKELEESYRSLRALSARLDSIREEESTRIAREVHDNLGQMLTALQIGVQTLLETDSKGDAGLEAKRVARLRSMGALIDEAIGSVQRISKELRPSVLDDLGLPAALESYLRDFEGRRGLRGRFRSILGETVVEGSRATAAFRIFQEILTNVARHAKATAVDVVLEEEGGELVLTVSDDGCGIPEGKIHDRSCLGLAGMHERAHVVEGRLTIRGTPGGTTVTLVVPL